MGAWDHKSFENDDALDWLADMERDGAKAVTAAFAAVNRIPAEDYLEAPEASAAVAAAEFVASARDGYAARLPLTALANFEKHRVALAAPAFVKEARRAIHRVMTNSELRELWHEGQDGAMWLADVKSVLDRLK